jgi:hypothetical protein
MKTRSGVAVSVWGTVGYGYYILSKTKLTLIERHRENERRKKGKD